MSYTPPLGVTTVGSSPANRLAYAALSASQWVVGSGFGAVLDGTSLAGSPRYFGYGGVQALAGSGPRLAISTGIGTTIVFDTSNWAQQLTLPDAYKQLALSADGSVLATRALAVPQGVTDYTVTTWSLPSAAVINTWPYTGSTIATDITLSSSGALLGQVITSPPSTVMRQVTAVSGGPVLWSDTNAGSQPIRLSMDDTLIAVSSDSNPAGTNIYQNDAFFSAAPGLAVTWLANDDLLATSVPGQTNRVIYNSAGILQQTTPLPSAFGMAGPVQVLGADSVYDPFTNRIYSVTTGAVTWSTATQSYGGVVAGSNVVFVANSQVVMQPF